MSRSKYWTCGCVWMVIGTWLALAVGPAAADVALPPRGKPAAQGTGPAAPFVVRRDPSEATSRILIPRKLLPAAKALLPAAEPQAAVPAGADDAEAANFARRTANAGCMLALVFAGGGLAIAFARRKGGVGKILSIGLIASTLLLGTALADIPSPFGRRPRPPQPEPPVPAPSAPASIQVQVLETGDEIVLILGRNAPDLSK